MMRDDAHDHEGEEIERPGPVIRAPGESKGERLAALLEERAPMVLSPTGRAYALVGSTARACESSDFVSWCASVFWREYREPISRGTVGDIIRALSGSGLPRRAIPIRVGGDLDRITLDLGEVALAVTARGVEAAPGEVFSRPPSTQALPEPVDPGPTDAAAAMDELRGALGVDARAWAACVAWLLAALRPAGPYPILYLRGEQGSGKSTLGKCLVNLIDPRRPDMIALPREPRDLAIVAEHAHVIAIDNVSTIAGEMSDALCRLATGDGFTIRSLYSDRDLAVFDAARPILMTSIVDAATRPDLLDRALIVDLPRPEHRRTDEEIRAVVERLRPRLLGALLHAASHALRKGEATIPDEVRMRAPAAFAALGAPAIGIEPDAIVRAYVESRTAAHGVVADDPIVDALFAFLPPGKAWGGTMTTLLDALNRRRGTGRPPRGWPESAKGLGAALRRLAPTLRDLGLTHTPPDGREGHDKARVHRLARAPE